MMLGEAAAAVRRWVPIVATAVSAASVILLLALLASTFLGYRLLVVRSDSMAPTLRAGDVLVTKLTRPSLVRPGDVVTFADPTRSNRLVTHRVVSQERADEKYSFVTRGDANTGTETWAVPRDGRIGEMVGRFPGLGFAVSTLQTPWMRLGVLSLGAVLGSTLALRRIWAW